MRRKDGRADKQIYDLTEKQRLEIRHTTSDDLTGRQGCCTRGPGKKNTWQQSELSGRRRSSGRDRKQTTDRLNKSKNQTQIEQLNRIQSGT